MRFCFQLLLIYCKILFAFDASRDDPVIYTQELGFIEGFHYKAVNDFETIVFLGVPYAKPPIGSLRFEKPQRFLNQSKTIINAKKYGASCYPHANSALNPKQKYSEDCLFINIMAPRKRTLTGYPVLMYIHGGGFESGSATDYDYREIVENFVSKEIVFVTINYRLGFLGFFTNGDRKLPGNIGLWDQIRALKFITHNIAAFCGNPKQITIMGHSAGSMSLAALSISSYSQNLFQQAISLSGSILAKIAVNERIVDNSRDLAQEVGCLGNDIDLILECMRAKSIDEFLDAVDAIGTSHKSANTLKFHPRIDDDLLTHSLDDMLRKSTPKASIIGTADYESALELVIKSDEWLWNISIPDSLMDNFNKDNFMHYVDHIVATETEYGGDNNELRKLLATFYLRDVDDSTVDKTIYIKRLIEMFSDIQFSLFSYIEAQQKMLYNWPIYLYEQQYSGKSLEKNMPIKGAYHGNELLYLFGFSLWEHPEFDNDDAAFKNVWLEAIVSFVRTGKPADEQWEWRKIDRKHRSQYLSLTPKPAMKSHYRNESIQFWTKFVPRKMLAKMTEFSNFADSMTDLSSHEEL